MNEALGGGAGRPIASHLRSAALLAESSATIGPATAAADAATFAAATFFLRHRRHRHCQSATGGAAELGQTADVAAESDLLVLLAGT